MKTCDFKTRILPNLIIGLIFALASAIYFWPALEGKVIYAGDNINSWAALQESLNYHKTTGDYTFWTGSMFSGMPNYQIGANGGSTLDKITYPIRWVMTWGYRNAFFIFFFYLCAFFVLLRSFKIDKWISMAGAFAIALSSYFFVIITATHYGKCYSIAWMMPVIVGFVLTYRKQYAWGALLVMFFTYTGFFKHPQMSYYICMMIGLFFFAELATAWKSKEWKSFGIATAIFAASFAVGLGMGSADIFSNMEYASETMRGGHSDLEKATDAETKTAGLDLDYATAWSYGIDETMTLLIPNFEGAASGYNVGDKSVLYNELTAAGVPRNSAKQFCQSAPTYRGHKAFTSGPVYVGAIICFLFLLGLLIVKGPYKWALLAATLFSVFLAWGHNMMWLTRLFFDYFPMYNKFRAVESILIVAEIAMPLLGCLALKTISDKELDYKQLKKSLCIAGGITSGLCLVVALAAGAIDITTDYDAQWKAQMPEFVYDAILAQRTAMIRSDAWRSLVFVLLGAGLTYLYAKNVYEKQHKNANLWFGVALAALIVADMWTVDKRFCNDSIFVSAKDREKAFKMQPYEKQLLEDKSHFRVLNLATNTFNESRTSYYLKSIGGYSAAKLRRYQDLIDVHIAPEINPLMQTIAQTNGFMLPCNGDSIFPVLNMLNMKYAIVPLQNGQQVPVENPYAMGNCWFVDNIKVTTTPNEEIAALTQIDLRTTAVADSAFVKNLDITKPEFSPLMMYDRDYIELTHYAPNHLTYIAQNMRNKIAVFSEIYYPYGWRLYITDDNGEKVKELPLARVNYMLRAAVIPAGIHNLRMEFDPDSLHKGNILSMSCFAIMLLTLVGAGGYHYARRRQKKNPTTTNR